MAWPCTFLDMYSVMIGLFFLYGYLWRISTGGGSVAKARAANVSMIKFTQSIYTAFKGDFFVTTAPKKTMNMAT